MRFKGTALASFDSSKVLMADCSLSGAQVRGRPHVARQGAAEIRRGSIYFFTVIPALGDDGHADRLKGSMVGRQRWWRTTEKWWLPDLMGPAHV